MSSAAAAPLLALDRLSAVFKPGQTALGHRWILRDGDEHEVGRTKLEYEGSGRTVGRLLRVTGLSTAGTLHAVVLDASGAELLRLHSTSGKGARVDVEELDGTPIGAARMRELSLELLAGPSDTVVGRIARGSREEMAFAVEDASGERLGVLTKQKIEHSLPSVSDMVFLPQQASNSIAFQATMHLGFAGSPEYHLLVERRPATGPLRTLLSLTPVIAAYAYAGGMS